MKEREDYREFYYRRTPRLVKMIGWGTLGVVALIVIAASWPFVIVGAGERVAVIHKPGVHEGPVLKVDIGQELFLRLQREAREAGRSLWGR